jgi:hypothetical protein
MTTKEEDEKKSKEKLTQLKEKITEIKSNTPLTATLDDAYKTLRKLLVSKGLESILKDLSNIFESDENNDFNIFLINESEFDIETFKSYCIDVELKDITDKFESIKNTFMKTKQQILTMINNDDDDDDADLASKLSSIEDLEISNVEDLKKMNEDIKMVIIYWNFILLNLKLYGSILILNKIKTDSETDINDTYEIINFIADNYINVIEIYNEIFEEFLSLIIEKGGKDHEKIDKATEFITGNMEIYSLLYIFQQSYKKVMNNGLEGALGEALEEEINKDVNTKLSNALGNALGNALSTTLSNIMSTLPRELPIKKLKKKIENLVIKSKDFKRKVYIIDNYSFDLGIKGPLLCNKDDIDKLNTIFNNNNNTVTLKQYNKKNIYIIQNMDYKILKNILKELKYYENITFYNDFKELYTYYISRDTEGNVYFPVINKL